MRQLRVDESIDVRALARWRRKERPDQLPPAHDLLSRPRSEGHDRRGQADATENQTGSRAQAEPEPSDPDRGAGHDGVDNGNDAGNRQERLSGRRRTRFPDQRLQNARLVVVTARDEIRLKLRLRLCAAERQGSRGLRTTPVESRPFVRPGRAAQGESRG